MEKYSSPQEYIYSFALFGKKGGYKPGLDRVNYMLSRVGNPHLVYPIIHVGGSNGKGSTVAFVDAVLQESGFQVGRFTSPHLTYYGERMAVNGQPMPEDELAELVEKLSPIFEEVEEKTDFGRPSFFEVTTLLALYYFARQGVDIVVLEVGLGGILDATNAVQPTICAITNIELEHTQYLGDTVEEIALQKAGIIKEGIPVITGAKEGALQVIKDVAKSRHSPCVVLQDDYQWERIQSNYNKQVFNLKTQMNNYQQLKIQLAGLHQISNAVMAVAILENLPAPLQVKKEDIIKGLLNTFWPGRLEIRLENPILVLDGAHNPSGFDTLVNFLKEEMPEQKVVFILSFLKDKDVTPYMEKIKSLASTVIFTQSQNFRAADPRWLKETAGSQDIPVEVIHEVGIALERGKILAGPDGVLCLAGSLYAVGEAREILGAKEYFVQA